MASPPKSKRRAQHDGSVASEIDNSAKPPTDKAEEFVKLLVYALSNAKVTRKLKEALGVAEQLAGLQQDIEAMRKAMRVRDDVIVELKKEVLTLRTQHDDLEQYTRRHSVRLTGLTETTDENVYDTVMAVFNEERGVCPTTTPVSMQAGDEVEQDR